MDCCIYWVTMDTRKKRLNYFSAKTISRVTIYMLVEYHLSGKLCTVVFTVLLKVVFILGEKQMVILSQRFTVESATKHKMVKHNSGTYNLKQLELNI